MNHTMKVENRGRTLKFTRIIVYNWDLFSGKLVDMLKFNDRKFDCEENVVAIFKIKWKK